MKFTIRCRKPYERVLLSAQIIPICFCTTVFRKPLFPDSGGSTRGSPSPSRLLAAQTPPEKHEEAIFEIVNQLNRGSYLIPSAEERERVAETSRLVSIAMIPSVDHRRKLRVFFENVSIENPRDLLRVFLEHWSS
jgi:hypothetical protein